MGSKLTIFIAVAVIVTAAANAASMGDDVMGEETPKVNLRFVYNFCNDVAEIRGFYTELLGLEELAYDEEYGWVNYQVEGLCYMFFRDDEAPVPVKAEFAAQPGWAGGTAVISSFSFEIPEADYPDMINKLRDAGVKSYYDAPSWEQDCYWCFPVLDPMGNTIEVFMSPKERPASTVWPEI